jgi:hypothetical protein
MQRSSEKPKRAKKPAARGARAAPPAAATAGAQPGPLTTLTPSDVTDLRVQVEDIIAAGLDATAPPSKRTLGQSEARRQIQEAAKKCRAIFALVRGGAP